VPIVKVDTNKVIWTTDNYTIYTGMETLYNNEGKPYSDVEVYVAINKNTKVIETSNTFLPAILQHIEMAEGILSDIMNPPKKDPPTLQ